MESPTSFVIKPHLKIAQAPSRSHYEADAQLRIELNGPPPLNPFTELRLSRSLNTNQLGIPTQVDAKALTRLERGMYVNPLPRVVDYWVNIGLATEGELLSDYENYRYIQRSRHRFFFGPQLNVDLQNPLHPFRQLRIYRPSLVDPDVALPVGLFETCASLCLPMDTVQHFEKRAAQASVPKEMKFTLNQLGYTYNQIHQFETHYKTWRGLNGKKVKVSG